MSSRLYTIVICEVQEPGKTIDIKYVKFAEISERIASMDNKSVKDQLRAECGYSDDTIISIKDIYVLNNEEEFKKYII